MPQVLPFIVTSLDVLKIHHDPGRHSVPGRSFHCLSLSLQGEMELQTTSSFTVSKTGTVTFVPAGISFISDVAHSRDIIAVHFTASGELPRDIAVFSTADVLNIREDFRVISELYDSLDPDKGFLCLSRFYALLDKLFDRNGFRRELSGFDRRILPALDHIRRNFREPSASDVEYLAQLCGFSSAYLRRIFVREFGMPPSEYVKKVRIDRACQLLSTGYYTVTGVAAECGFGDPSFFAREFRRLRGMTPSAYAGSCVSAEGGGQEK